jgi:redox-sensitive bicupin YhaK (pirin superfamily)
MENTIIQRGVRAVETTAMAPGGSATHRIRPVLDSEHWKDSDPFLMLNEDWFTTGTFADHPHRGIETVTYVIEGELLHFDNHGRSGALHPGDAQWMTAGRGVIHNEDAHAGKPLNTLQALREDT